MSSTTRTTANIDDVLITAELAHRLRAPDFQAESLALGALAREMAENPGGVLQNSAQRVLDLCHADSAGVSILEGEGPNAKLRWHAAVGDFAGNLNGVIPRYASPCGTVMDRDCVLLFREAERFFPALRTVEPPIYENLLAPWRVDGKPIGTLWAIKHTPGGRFDSEDARVLKSLAGFAAAAYQTASALETLKAERAELERRTKALHDAEARLRSAIDLVGLSPYTWDPTTGALEWDGRLKAIWGLPPDAHVDANVFLSAIHPEDRARVEAAIGYCLDPAGSGVYDIEYRVIGIGDGVERWVSTYGRTTFQNEMAVGFIGAALDITDRKRSEADLRESEERFRQFAENSSDTLFILSFETLSLEYASPAFAKIWGEASGHAPHEAGAWTQLLHVDDRQRALGALERVALGDVCMEEFRVVRPEGAMRWIRTRLFPIRNDRGRICKAGGIAQDITRNDSNFVYVVDGDVDSRRNLSNLLRDAGYRIKDFSTGRSFLEAAPALLSGCVVLDICRASAGALAIPRELKARRIGLPVVVVGLATTDVNFGVEVMKAGAVDFLPAPFDPDRLLTAVASAAAMATADEPDQDASRARQRISELSEREREVLAGLLAGKTNKEIGRDLGLSPRTIETHRAHVMQRLGVQTLSQAILIAAAAGFQSSAP